VEILNFVEIMALYRAFSVGEFKCSGTSPKIAIADYFSEGYVLKIHQRTTNKYCKNCIRNFFNNRRLCVDEDENYLTIRSV
jgi:hypothetical protein